MQVSQFHDKYPVYSKSFNKNELSQSSVDELIGYFTNLIEQHPKAKLIEIFDHYAHTTGIDGTVAPEIKAAKMAVFCFGLKLDNPLAMAVRPRSIGVADMGDHFTISFMEAPNPAMNDTMVQWVQDLAK